MRGNKDRILILVMLCNLPQYKEREEDIRETWAKETLEGKYSNIEVWFFTSGEENKIDVENHKIYVRANDGRDRTFQKLMKTLFLINPKSYDWIVRVNVSTYLNVNLIDKILQHSPSEEFLYAGTLFSQPWILDKMPFLSGEYMIFHKTQVDILKKFYKANQDFFDKLEEDPRTDTNGICDDGWITKCFSMVWKAEKDIWEYSKRIHSLGLLYECDKVLSKEPKIDYNKIPGICFKTMTQEDDKVNLDKNPIHSKEDISKLYEIDYQCKTAPISGDILDEWYKWYVLNVYDKLCYPYDHVLESQKHKRDISKAITKREMIQWYKDYKKFKKK